MRASAAGLILRSCHFAQRKEDPVMTQLNEATLNELVGRINGAVATLASTPCMLALTPR